MEELDENLEYNYDLIRTAEWIKNSNFEVVSLQFPDDMLCDSYSVCEALKKLTSKRIYISVDTTYSNCCIDEISAKHVDAEAIVHYGHACLSPTTSKVLYVHPKSTIEIDRVVERCEVFIKDNPNVVIFYHPSYEHSSSKLMDSLFNSYPTILCATLNISNSSVKPIFGRYLINSKREVQNIDSLEEYHLIYIGGDDQTLFNLAITLKTKGLHMLNTLSYELKPYSQSAWLKRRRYIIEKCKDAKNIGILVCTLSITNFTAIIERLKTLIKLNGKRSYVMTLGKPNVAKLSNLYEMDIFVLIACPENDLYSCKEFLTPLAYPFELELALNKLRDPYASDYFTDFNDLLTDGKGYCDLVPNTSDSDISLITGKARYDEDAELASEESSSTDIVAREKLTMAKLYIGDHLGERSWKGLEQKLGETNVEDVQKGRSGIAGGYNEEPS